MNTLLVGKFIRESVPIYLSVVLLLLTTINLHSGVSYYLIVTAVFIASIIAMTDERVRYQGPSSSLMLLRYLNQIVLPFMES